MDCKLISFQKLADKFKRYGFSLYLVGGAVRDYLLGKPLTDLDAVTDATPDDIKQYFEGDYSFKKFGFVRLNEDGMIFEVTTLRKESEYLDSRHPSKIVFVKELEIDVERRDFTINSMYLDSNLDVIDYVGGLEDLNKKIIKIVGNPKKKFSEDPLRILRAIRFSIDLEFSIENHTKTSIFETISLLDKLNPEKIKEEISKIKSSDTQLIYKTFEYFNILKLLKSDKVLAQ
ncbi:MAG: CCA tRNA nucleotidyltransferase [Bacilli bacterium]|nr:CCA tRNA nucleotidyltransferase [Bacilli bacterium]